MLRLARGSAQFAPTGGKLLAGRAAMSLLLGLGWFEGVEDDGVGDGADWCGVALAAFVAVGAAAFTGAGCGAAVAGGDQVGGFGQLRGEVGQGAGQVGWGERAARVVESWAAWKARLKLIRPGSSPAGVA